MSTSIDSLVDALSSSDRAARLLGSPTSTKGTGDTGSSESNGHATRSLIKSVSSREITARLPPAEQRSRSTSPEISPAYDQVLSDPTDITPPASPSQILRMYTAPSSNGSSWSEISRVEKSGHLPMTQEPRHEGSFAGEMSFAEEELGTRITASQEEAGLQHSVTRSQSDFSRWLEDTMAHARGDGTSTVDSEEFQAIASATRRARIGLGYSDADLQPHTPSENAIDPLDARSQLHSSIKEEEQDDFDLSEIISLKLEDSVAIPAIATTVKEEEVSEPEEEKAVYMVKPASTATATRISSDSRWKFVSAGLGVALLASLLQSHGTGTLCKLKSTPAPTQVDLDEHIRSLWINMTSDASFIPPVPYTLDYSTGLAVTMGAVLFLFALGTIIARQYNGPAQRKRVRIPSPLLEMDPVSIVRARQLIEEGEAFQAQGRLEEARAKLAEAASSRCAPVDKAIASERLGMVLYRLATSRGSNETLREAADSLQKAVRLNPQSATARAAWGRTLYHLSDFTAALRPLQIAIRRDDDLAMAHEYLGKTLFALGDSKTGEAELRRAIDLDRTSYSAYAFLGDQLHTRGRTEEGKVLLQSAIQLRHDYPAAHARLAFIAAEQLQHEATYKHLSTAIACRESGFIDLSLISTTEAIQGSSPFLRLYFATAKEDTTQRIKVVEEARKVYPNEHILVILLAINLRRMKDRDARSSGLEQLRTLEGILEKRVARYPDDSEGRGLLALALIGLGKKKKAIAEYDTFWKQMSTDRAVPQKPYLVMAFFELRKK